MTFRGVTDELVVGLDTLIAFLVDPSEPDADGDGDLVVQVVDWYQVHREAVSRETHCQDTFEAAQGQVVELREWAPSWCDRGCSSAHNAG